MKHSLIFLYLLTIAGLSVGQENKGTINITKPKGDTTQSAYSDTIRINNATFKIKLPDTYKSKLIPKIAGGRFILTDKDGKLYDIFVNSYVCTIMNNGAVSQYYTYNSLNIPTLFAISKKDNFKGTIIIEAMEGETPGGVLLKNLTDYFYLEKVR